MLVTNAVASQNIIAAANEGRLVQRAWHARHEGREVACLLGSIHPSVKSAKDCNADLMPLWLADLTVQLFDGIAKSETTAIALRYGALVGRWHVLSGEQWNGILTKFLIRTVDDALEAARPAATGGNYWPAVESACKQVAEALKEGDKAKLDAARMAARMAADAAYAAARMAAYAPDAAAYAAAYAAADAAAYAAAYAAARMAAYAAADAAAYAAACMAAYAAADAAAYAAALRLFTFLLDLIEAELKTVGG